MEQESIEKAVAFIETHLTEEWSLETLAREAGYSPYHFARLFRKATGRSVMEYVRDKRIDAAAERLRQGQTVMETALLDVLIRRPSSAGTLDFATTAREAFRAALDSSCRSQVNFIRGVPPSIFS